jgi:hypothetical protein
MTTTTYVGLAYSSHDNSALGTATFSQVSLTGPNVNSPPTLSTIAAQTINEDGSTAPLAFTIGDAETPASNLTLSVTSSVPTLVPMANLVLGGAASNRTITVTPTLNASGNSTITLTVSDSSKSTASSFVLTVLPVNDAPVANSDVLTRWMSQGVMAPVANLLTNDTDVDGDTLTLLSLGASSPGLSLTLSNNFVRYWPQFGSTNADQFTYQVSDNHGGAATGLVNVVVIPDPAGVDLLNITAQPGPDFRVQLSGIPGFTYTVQYSDTLTPPTWQNLGVVTANELGQVEITDPPVPGNTTRYYRAVRGLAP